MLTYYIDYRETAGQFEIHHANCPDLPDRNHLIYLGRHDSAIDALAFGRTIFAALRACELCCSDRNLRNSGPDYKQVASRPRLPAEDVVH